MSDSNPYAQFGVTNAVISGDNYEEHQQAMLALDVSTRDGDDSIDLVRSDDAGVTVTDLVDDELNTEDRIEVNIPTEGEYQADVPEDEAGDQTDVLEGEFTPLGDIPDELNQASNQISEYATGFEQMQAQAIERGLPQAAADQVRQEYEENGELSEASLKALEEAGFGRGFVKAYIQGQESLATQYMSHIMDYAGGKESFQRIVAHMQSNTPDSIEVLEDAIQRQDIKAVKQIINLATQSQTKKFGKTPARNLGKNAPASVAQRVAPKAEGFASTAAMVDAMGDPRYGKDPAYRAQVQAKVAASNW